MISYHRNSAKMVLFPWSENYLVFLLGGVKMVRKIFQKFGFTSDGCVADSWGNHSVLVKDSEQIDNMGFRDLIH